jgi:hypothetical protein
MTFIVENALSVPVVLLIGFAIGIVLYLTHTKSRLP